MCLVVCFDFLNDCLRESGVRRIWRASLPSSLPKRASCNRDPNCPFPARSPKRRACWRGRNSAKPGSDCSSHRMVSLILTILGRRSARALSSFSFHATRADRGGTWLVIRGYWLATCIQRFPRLGTETKRKAGSRRPVRALPVTQLVSRVNTRSRWTKG